MHDRDEIGAAIALIPLYECLNSRLTRPEARTPGVTVEGSGLGP